MLFCSVPISILKNMPEVLMLPSAPSFTFSHGSSQEQNVRLWLDLRKQDIQSGMCHLGPASLLTSALDTCGLLPSLVLPSMRAGLPSCCPSRAFQEPTRRRPSFPGTLTRTALLYRESGGGIQVQGAPCGRSPSIRASHR